MQLVLAVQLKHLNAFFFNFGGSHVLGGSSDYGNRVLSNYAAKAGIVIKFGNIRSSSDSELRSRLKVLEEEKKSLISRLERLEAIVASSQSN